jgi:hypothetical protein
MKEDTGTEFQTILTTVCLTCNDNCQSEECKRGLPIIVTRSPGLQRLSCHVDARLTRSPECGTMKSSHSATSSPQTDGMRDRPGDRTTFIKRPTRCG